MLRTNSKYRDIMWNQRSIDHVNQSSFSSSFRKPLYKSYCFSKIPSSVQYLLTNETRGALPKDCFGSSNAPFDSVVLFLIDGFGWKFFERCWQKHPFLSRFASEGVVSKITSQFPSTTAAHVTTINTAKEVGTTGIYEWFQYEPKAERIIAPLLFSIAGEKVLGNLEKKGITPEMIYPRHTFYQKLKRKGVDSFVVQPENIIHSPYSKTLTKGAHPIAFFDFDQGLKTLCEALSVQGGAPNYFLVYFPDIDSCGHRSGVDSKEFEETIARCMQSLETSFFSQLKKGNRKIACLVAADHGMVSINPHTTCYINQEIKGLADFIQTNPHGQLLSPAGSCRDLFLHVKKSHLKHTQSLLQNYLKNIAEVHLVEDLIKAGFFGSKAVSERFLERVGNLVILPFENESVWWYEKGVFEQHFYGSHGGLCPVEMETPFLFLPIC